MLCCHPLPEWNKMESAWPRPGIGYNRPSPLLSHAVRRAFSGEGHLACVGYTEWRVVTSMAQAWPQRGTSSEGHTGVCWQASLTVTAWRLGSGCLGSSPGSSTHQLCDLYMLVTLSGSQFPSLQGGANTSPHLIGHSKISILEEAGITQNMLATV